MSEGFDRELEDLPPPLRWREWMARAEAVLFASSDPVPRERLARVVGRDCVLDDLIEDISIELGERPYEIARARGGWLIRTRAKHGATIRAALGDEDLSRNLTQNEALVLTIIACLQPVTRREIARLTGREVGRELIARLSREGMIARGPRSPEPGAPYSYVTTPEFLLRFGLETLRDLPDFEAMEDAGLLSRRAETALDLPIAAQEEE